MKTILRVAALCGLCFLLVVSHRALGFWSKVTIAGIGLTPYPVHQDITKSALNQATFAYSSVAGGGPFSFTQPAIDAITDYNVATDDPSNYDPREHFDSEFLQAGFKLLAAYRVELLTELQKQSPDQQVVWTLLGTMLHQIQDFYSHSTWVADKNVGIAGFGVLTENNPGTTVPAFLLPRALIGTVCAPDSVTLTQPLAPSSQITTGYYDVAVPVGHCNHGSVVTEAANCVTVLSQRQPPDGVNHDSPCFASQADVDVYTSALTRAQQETLEFVTSIVTDLNTAHNAQGFCILLGIDLSQPVCAPTITLIPVGTSIALSIQDLGPGSGSLMSGTQSAAQNCSSPCTSFANTGSFSSSVSVNDTWSGYGGAFYADSSLQGSVSFTTGTSPTMAASTSWTVDPGGFTGGFGGTIAFTTTTPYVVTITCTSSSTSGACVPNCYSLPYSSSCNYAIQASISGPSVTSTMTANSVQFTLPSAGQYVLTWQLVGNWSGGSGPGCCLGTSGDTGSVGASTSLNVAFQAGGP